MSTLTWGAAIARIAGCIAGSKQPDALAAARDALTEAMQDWDSRHDWRFTQVVAPDIAITGSSDEFSLPTNYKKPYVAYLETNKRALWFVERGNWHRAFPGDASTRSIPCYYTLFNNESGGVGQLFPQSSVSDTLVVLYYRSIITDASDSDVLDLLGRWEGYVLDGARANLTLAKGVAQKYDRYIARYEAGIAKARQDDRRLPDQFLSFEPPQHMIQPYWMNPNSTYESTLGI